MFSVTHLEILKNTFSVTHRLLIFVSDESFSGCKPCVLFLVLSLNHSVLLDTLLNTL